MASTQQILSALTDMQRNAQASLPVLPNNGNPAGAYNMPHSKEGAASAAPSGPDLTWLQPSEHMLNVQEWLASRRNRNGIQNR